jgi:septum formation protein
MVPGIDEKAIRTSDPKLLPALIAKAKAEAIFERLKADYGADSTKSFILLTADQIVLYKGEVREKPETREEAHSFLSSYSDDSVSTISAVVATHFPSGRQAHEVEVATVYWNKISAEVVHRVVDRNEVFTSAGGPFSS